MKRECHEKESVLSYATICSESSILINLPDINEKVARRLYSQWTYTFVHFVKRRLKNEQSLFFISRENETVDKHVIDNEQLLFYFLELVKLEN